MTKRPDRRAPLCSRCDREFFAGIVKAHPEESVKEWARRAKPRLGYVPNPVTLHGFLRDQGIEMLPHARKYELRFEKQRVKARQPLNRQRPPQSLVLEEHRALTRYASVFAMAGGSDDAS